MMMMMMMMADRPADCVFETDPGGHRMTLHLKTDQAADGNFDPGKPNQGQEGYCSAQSTGDGQKGRNND